LNDGTGIIKIDLLQIEVRVFPKEDGRSVVVYGELANNDGELNITAAKIELQ
jgi:hypothetical protein